MNWIETLYPTVCIGVAWAAGYLIGYKRTAVKYQRKTLAIMTRHNDYLESVLKGELKPDRQKALRQRGQIEIGRN